MRLFLVAANKLEPGDAFPDLFKTAEEEEVIPDEEVAVIYKFEDATVTQEMVEQQIRELAALAAEGTASFQESLVTFNDWV